MKKVITTLALLAVIAAPGILRAQDTDSAPADQKAAISAEENVQIKKIEIVGAFEVKEADILAAVESKVGDPISTNKLEEDLQRIFDLGFFSEDVKVNLSEYEGGAKISFKVVENPVIGKINVTGNKAIPTAELLAAIGTKENKILNKKLLKTDVEAVEKLYKDKGYIVARVATLNTDDKNNLNIVVAEGTIQAIEIIYIVRDEDNKEITSKNKTGKTKPVVILREMKTAVGETLNSEKLKRDLQRVFNLGFFNDVSWDINTDPNSVEFGKIIVQVQVEEAKTGQVGFGAGYSSNTGLTGFLSYSEQNLRGMGRRVSTHLEFGKKRDDFQVGYFEPWIDKKQTSFEVNLYNTSQNQKFGQVGGLSSTALASSYATATDEIHRGLNFTVGRPISDNTRAYVGMKLENVNVEPSEFDYLDGAARALNLSLRTDTRDNVVFPTQGRFDSGTVELNGGLMGGDYDYKKFFLDLRHFHQIKPKKQTIGVHMFMGMGSKKTPTFDFFDVGGVNTVRGYEEYYRAGSKALYFNTEYRIAMGGNLSGVLFADAGATWNKLADMGFRSKDFSKSVGAGIRLQIPQLGGFGPIRLDYAYAISIKNSKIHFGFGHMF